MMHVIVMEERGRQKQVFVLQHQTVKNLHPAGGSRGRRGLMKTRSVGCAPPPRSSIAAPGRPVSAQNRNVTAVSIPSLLLTFPFQVLPACTQSNNMSAQRTIFYSTCDYLNVCEML